MLFICGVALETILCVLSMFVGTMYSQDWGYAKVYREKAYSAGIENSFTLLGMYDWWYGIIIGLVIAVSILYLIVFLKNHVNAIPGFVIVLLYLLPVVFMFIGIGELRSDGQYVEIGFITIGSGTQSGLTAFGCIYLFGTIAALILMSVGMAIKKEKIIAEGKREVTEVKTKTPKKKQKDNDKDWKW